MASQVLESGYRLDKYEVLSHIATGGMGTVYKAMDLDLRRLVALKVLSGELAARPVILERFRREARHAARLSHKNIVTLYEWGQDKDLYYLALEYIQGIDLGAYIERKGKIPAEEARRILIQAAKALEHAFEQGITHRDIKPSNFLLTNQGRRMVVKLTDMGLARAQSDDEFRVTRAGSTVGTIDYMPPEQARDSGAADTRSDIYALGCTAYHMLTGHPPFSEGGLGERLYKHMEVAPPDIRLENPDVSVAFRSMVERMLAKDPDDRYQTPTDLLDDLKRITSEAGKEEESSSEAAPTGPLPTAPTPSSSSDQELPGVPYPPPPKETSRKKRVSAPESGSSSTNDSSQLAGFSAEQAQAAAGQYQRASQMIREGATDVDYLRQLLLSCCKLDPANTQYRKALRQLQKTTKQGLLGRWMGSLSTMAAKSRLRGAKGRGEHRKVLELGEEVLIKQPNDTATPLDMAESAEALGLLNLAAFLLEQAHDLAPTHGGPARALAIVYEKQNKLGKAIMMWEVVQKAEPDDHDIQRKIDALSVKDHISRGNYRRSQRG